MEPPPTTRPPVGRGDAVHNGPPSQEAAFPATQQPTQATQQAASQPQYEVDPNVWGELIPLDSENTENIVFQRWKRTYQIGRSPAKEYDNDVVLPGLLISKVHCKITWDGATGPVPSIVVTDLSSNGTFINRERIGKARTALLRDGSELSFGSWEAQDTEDEKKTEFRYIYRHVAYSRPTDGLYQHYDLQDELGKGTFATVMKALRRDDGKWYAVKIIDLNKLRKDWSHLVSNTLDVAEISKEISILQRLQHPNICELKDFFFDSTSLSLVLEWISGGDLLHFLLDNYTTERRMSERRAQYLTYQICKALAYVHSRGIAHRDLKPENVLLTSDTPPIVKVADFGLAKAIDGESILKTVCGTPVYLAPEVITQAGQGYSLVVDSWSVGVIVFSMLTMATPFRDDSKATLEQVMAKRVPEWGVLNECGVSAEAEDFLRGLLEKDPQKRMNMADACVHRWLAAEVEQDLNISNAPHPPRDTASTIDPSTHPGSSATSSTISNSEAAASGRASQPSPFKRLQSFSSVPGLQHGRPQEPSPSYTPQHEPEDMLEDDAGPSRRARLTKRTASSAFSSSSSIGEVEVAPVDAPGSIPRAALSGDGAEMGYSTAHCATGRAPPPSKRARLETVGPSSSEDS